MSRIEYFLPPLAVALSLLLNAHAFAQTEPAMPASQLHYFSFDWEQPVPAVMEADVCIYGGTAAGVIAAVQLKRLGKSVVLVEPGEHLGGLSSGGLSFTDIGNKAAIGGMSREFYGRVGAKYGVAEEWRFEPSVAEAVFNEMVAEAEVPVLLRHFLQDVHKENGRLTAITTRGGATVRAKMFMDATYEGDLMARAGVAYRVGREGNYEYSETLSGVQVRDKHQFEQPIDPYIVPGDPQSGVLPEMGIDPAGPGEIGSSDESLQAYNFRLCLTKDPVNKLPFPQPDDYDAERYVLLQRYLDAGWDNLFYGIQPLRNSKFDMNNAGAVSTDFIGENHAYPGADYLDRERIFQRHVSYQMGWLWYVANDPRVPEKVRARMNEFGLARDEFTATGGWPHQLYVREARRMVADYIMTEHNCRGAVTVPDPVGLAAYTMDSHNCRRFVDENGHVRNEGDVQVGGFPPYPISYRSVVPRRADCENLLVPVCLATTHIAYGSIRMEPVFMILGQSCALAAALAIDNNIAVQDVEYSALRRQLDEAGQVLAWKG